MSLITQSNQAACCRCKKMTEVLYSSYICGDCFLKVNGKRFKGAGSYHPCTRCQPPEIKWYYREVLRKHKKYCSDHESVDQNIDDHDNKIKQKLSDETLVVENMIDEFLINSN